jgi:sec-independent protein translocase protein TatB
MLKKVGSWIGTTKKYINNIQNEVSNIDIEDNNIQKDEFKKKDKKEEKQDA